VINNVRYHAVQGAREFVVPTHMPGKYYTLPQSPQQVIVFFVLLFCAVQCCGIDPEINRVDQNDRSAAICA